MSRQSTVEFIEQHRLSAILRCDDEGLARDAMQAAVAGGFRVVEFTMTVPGCLHLIEEFSAKDGLCVGAGTVLSQQQLEDVQSAGASFVVSPICDPAIIGAARERELATIPGTFTATEMVTAQRAGADFVKLFPSPGNVADYVRAIRGPLPSLRVFPTAGVDPGNFLDVLRAGAAGVGFVRPLFEPADLAARRFDAIEARARAIHARLGEL